MNLAFVDAGRQYQTAWLVTTLLLVLFLLVGTSSAAAQQRIGYIDSDQVLDQLPEYGSIQQELDQLERDWRSEIEAQQDEVRDLVEDFQARELLYTPEERERQQERIREARREVEQLRSRYFGPDGLLFQRQQELMRPLQERVLEAVETVAEGGGYDYVFDKADSHLFMFARPQHNLTEDVVFELGIDFEQSN
ncbi:MAG: OmpH family outer membrane protein [Longimonas sp.]|uniref:OmpH family outer membrane protein n=1 Tax=Longimonas sp. TaxID=2039626 RepID=UPI0033620B22